VSIVVEEHLTTARGRDRDLTDWSDNGSEYMPENVNDSSDTLTNMQGSYSSPGTVKTSSPSIKSPQEYENVSLHSFLLTLSKAGKWDIWRAKLM
jgi:hypothetical protein